MARQAARAATTILVTLVTAGATAATRAPESLQVAVEDSADLWSRPDGTGFANEIVKTVFRAANVDVSFVVVPYARCKKMVMEGAIAACFTMSAAPDLVGAVRFPSTPLFRCYTELLQNPAAKLPAVPLANLPKGTVIGSVLGYEYPDEVVVAARLGAIRLEASPSEAVLLRKLSAGRLAGALVNVNESKPLAYISAIAGVATGFERARRIGALDSYIGFSMQHPRATWAHQRYDDGMRRVAAGSELARIARNWTDSAQAVIRSTRSPARRGAP